MTSTPLTKLMSGSVARLGLCCFAVVLVCRILKSFSSGKGSLFSKQSSLAIATGADILKERMDNAEHSLCDALSWFVQLQVDAVRLSEAHAPLVLFHSLGFQSRSH
eukprot:3936281-Amphidinium_carterae.2